MAYSAGMAILISLLAGLATVVGGGLSIMVARHMKPIMFAAALAFAAGCTLTVAFADVLPEGQSAWHKFLTPSADEAIAQRRLLSSSDEDDEALETRHSAIGLLIMLLGWVLASAFDKALHLTLDAYDHWHGASEHIHVGVCAHDHGHDHSHADRHPVCSDMQEQMIPSQHSAHSITTIEHGAGDTSSITSTGGAWTTIGRFFKTLVIGTSTLTAEEERQLNDQFMSDPKKISRLGYFTATVLALHNLPEGIALYGTATADEKAGLGLAAAIALHNLPQGMAIAVPIYIGLGSWWKALSFSAAAAVAQPLGALMGYGLVGATPSDKVMSVMLLLTAGVLFNASLKELYGSAVRYDKGNQVCGSFMFIGMLIMSTTLIALAYV